MCIPLGQTCEKHASMDFHVKNMSAGSDPKYINHSLFFFFLARIVPIDRRIKKTPRKMVQSRSLRSILASRILYRELLFFMFLCSYKSLRFITNSEKYVKFILKEENCCRKIVRGNMDTGCNFDFNKGKFRNVKKNITKCINDKFR